MKKIISAVLIAVLLITLAACGGVEPSESSIAPDASSQEVSDSQSGGESSAVSSSAESSDVSSVESADTSSASKAETSSAESSASPVESSTAGTSSSSQAEKSECVLVALGDSITYGYGLADVEKERYSALLATDLKQSYDKVTEYNYGVNGQTGVQLAHNLASASLPEHITDADVIVISIGGNNILGKLSNMLQKEGGSLEELTSLSDEYIAYLSSTTSPDPNAECVVRVSETIEEINTALTSQEMQDNIDKAAEELKEDIASITETLKKLNPDARIIVQTIYNPYKDVVLLLPLVPTKLDMDTIGEQAVAKLNAVLVSKKDKCGYELIDVFSAFEKSTTKLINAGLDFANFTFSADPHPNAAGHSLIAQLYAKQITGKA